LPTADVDSGVDGQATTFKESSMGDKSPKDKNKKQAQKSAVQAQTKSDQKKQQQAFDHTPKKTK